MFISESGRNLKWFESLPKDKRRVYLMQHPKSKFHKRNPNATPVPKDGIVKKHDAEIDARVGTHLPAASTKDKHESPEAKKFFIGLKKMLNNLVLAAKRTQNRKERSKLLAKIKHFKQMLSERNSKFARNRFLAWKKIRAKQFIAITKQYATASDGKELE